MQGGVRERLRRRRHRPSAVGIDLSPVRWRHVVLGALWVSLGAPATATDLSGIWQVTVEAEADSRQLLCGMLPAFAQTFVDTVQQASSAAELIAAIIPDTLQAEYALVCQTTAVDADRVHVACTIPIDVLEPCALVVAFRWDGALIHPDTLAGGGEGNAQLSGGYCPRTGCPGRLDVQAVRLAAWGTQE